MATGTRNRRWWDRPIRKRWPAENPALERQKVAQLGADALVVALDPGFLDALVDAGIPDRRCRSRLAIRDRRLAQIFARRRGALLAVAQSRLERFATGVELL